jgi:hypothetical protein
MKAGSFAAQTRVATVLGLWPATTQVDDMYVRRRKVALARIIAPQRLVSGELNSPKASALSAR